MKGMARGCVEKSVSREDPKGGRDMCSNWIRNSGYRKNCDRKLEDPKSRFSSTKTSWVEWVSYNYYSQFSCPCYHTWISTDCHGSEIYRILPGIDWGTTRSIAIRPLHSPLRNSNELNLVATHAYHLIQWGNSTGRTFVCSHDSPFHLPTPRFSVSFQETKLNRHARSHVIDTAFQTKWIPSIWLWIFWQTLLI